MFLNTLNNIINNVAEDKRGKYEHKNRVIGDDMIKSVCDHVKSFPLVESHYVRQNLKKLYLEGVKS